MEELKIKIEKIENNKDNEIDTQINKTKKELEKIKINIDNIIFCRLKKELQKNEQIFLKLNINNTNEIAMMRTITELNIIPVSSLKNNDNKKDTSICEYLYFLLSKTKSKNISPDLNPFDFWNMLLKFKGLK